MPATRCFIPATEIFDIIAGLNHPDHLFALTSRLIIRAEADDRLFELLKSVVEECKGLDAIRIRAGFPPLMPDDLQAPAVGAVGEGSTDVASPREAKNRHASLMDAAVKNP